MGVSVCMFLCFCFYLPDFSFTLCLGFVFCFFFFGLFVLIPFIAMTACGVLVPWPEVGPEPLGWERWVQDVRSAENFWPQGVLLRENSHKGLHHSTACSTAALDTSPKQQARQEHKPDHQQTGLPTDTPKYTTSHGPAHQREKTHLPPGCRHKAFTSHQTNLIHQGKKPETILSSLLGTNSLQMYLLPLWSFPLSLFTDFLSFVCPLNNGSVFDLLLFVN